MFVNDLETNSNQALLRIKNNLRSATRVRTSVAKMDT